MFEVFDKNENNAITEEEMRSVFEYIQKNGMFAKVLRGSEIDECLEMLGFTESNRELGLIDFLALMLPGEKVKEFDERRIINQSIRRDREKQRRMQEEDQEDGKGTSGNKGRDGKNKKQNKAK